jgi:hypothetical protein
MHDTAEWQSQTPAGTCLLHGKLVVVQYHACMMRRPAHLSDQARTRFKLHEGSRLGLVSMASEVCVTTTLLNLINLMRALWLPDPAILRRGESPFWPGVKCMMNAGCTSRQSNVHAFGRRTPAAQGRMAAASVAETDRRADDPTIVTEGGLPRSAVVGVLGGGQLGKMLAIEAVRPGPGPPANPLLPTRASHRPHTSSHRFIPGLSGCSARYDCASRHELRQDGVKVPLRTLYAFGSRSLPVACAVHAGANGGERPCARSDARLPRVHRSSPGAPLLCRSIGSLDVQPLRCPHISVVHRSGTRGIQAHIGRGTLRSYVHYCAIPTCCWHSTAPACSVADVYACTSRLQLVTHAVVRRRSVPVP